ncbi:hypothetical protein [Evansella cellulosilytica]|uniref:Uncharacterized protein n=1 Tax=Evansella cellulosilytica (strain ATCC 21833 / DSM 2522 / FERM P-1141 / JCM 9156 / N-4) TaxID=649639 RepID=E6TYA7_EVAC2|nr:hypothetical protein [Evansella cellulosilytica]ADU28845.1 hypothetical protein Bcell_0563 [Evansella cellulosilytica DSM 2522]
MSLILYDLILVVFGMILGVMIKDPLKNIFTGKYKENARQKKRVKLLVSIRGSEKPLTTEELAQNVFNSKLKIVEVHQLLRDIEEIGFIKGITSKDKDTRKTKWRYIKEK